MAYFFMSNTVIAYQRFPTHGLLPEHSPEECSSSGLRRTDTGKHRCIHITQKEATSFFCGKTRRQLHAFVVVLRNQDFPDCQHCSHFPVPSQESCPSSPAENTVLENSRLTPPRFPLFRPVWFHSCSSALVSSGSLSE